MSTTTIPQPNHSQPTLNHRRSRQPSRRPAARILLRWGLALACLLALARTQAQTLIQTTGGLTPAQRLEHQHLQAAHQARLGFAQERRHAPANGLYEDYRAVVLTDAKDADPGKGPGPELLAAAGKAGVQVILSASHSGPKSDAWRGLHDGVLFIAGSQTDSGTLEFPETGPDGKALPGSGLRFLGRLEQGSPAATEGMSGMVFCNGHTGALPGNGCEEYLAAAGADPARWQSLVADYRSYPDEFFAAGTDDRRDLFAAWDENTAKRFFTGIAVHDAQQSPSLRRLTPDAQEISFRSLTTHILARGLTEPLIREALTNGHM